MDGWRGFAEGEGPSSVMRLEGCPDRSGTEWCLDPIRTILPFADEGFERGCRFSVSNRPAARCCGAKCSLTIPCGPCRELLIASLRAIVEKPCKMGLAGIVAAKAHGR